MCVCERERERERESERDIGLCVIARVGECVGVNVSDGSVESKCEWVCASVGGCMSEKMYLDVKVRAVLPRKRERGRKR